MQSGVTNIPDSEGDTYGSDDTPDVNGEMMEIGGVSLKVPRLSCLIQTCNFQKK